MLRTTTSAKTPRASRSNTNTSFGLRSRADTQTSLGGASPGTLSAKSTGVAETGGQAQFHFTLHWLGGWTSYVCQGRTATSKIFFYKREAARVLGWALTHWQSLEGLAILLGATGVAIIVIAALALVVGTLTSSEEAEEKKRR
eukprot:g13413.t1